MPERQFVKTQKSAVPDAPVEDLRGFLVKKIRQVQDRSDPLLLDRQIRHTQTELPQEEGESQKKLKFKASTLTHIAELKPFGQLKIENQFIDRLYRQQTNYYYEKYVYEKKKEYTSHAAAQKYCTNQRTSLIQKEENFQTQTSEPLSNGTDGKQRFRAKKPKNIVQEQLARMDRIDKETDKMNAMIK